MTPSERDPARDAALAALLGCGPAAGPRAMLGLGDGSVDIDTLEAALSSRRRAIEANASTRGLADEAIRMLELAAAALRPSATGRRASSSPASPASPASPVSPVAPVPPVRPVRPPGRVAPPPGPIATRAKTPVHPGQPRPAAGPIAAPTPVRPTPRITAAHLTPFDRLVLSILVSGGGWNARTRVLVAGLAHQVGLDAAALRRVVSGLASFMRQEGVAGTFGEVARAESRPVPPPAPGRIESAMLRVAEGVGREFRGDSRSSLYKLVTLFGLLAVFFGVILVTALTAPSPVVRDTNLRRREAEEILTRRLEETAAERADHVVVPSTRPGVVRPVTFERPPMFRGDGVPESVVFDLGRMPAALDDLERIARRLGLDVERLPDVVKVQWDDAVDLFARTWPRLEPDDRVRAVDALLAVLAFAHDPQVADRLVSSFKVEPEAPVREELDSWTRAFRGGVLGEIVVRQDLPDPVRETARRIVSTRLPGSDGRHVSGGPFAALGGRSLDATGMALLEQAGGVDRSTFEDAWERWFEAQSALRRPDARQRAMISTLGRVLALDRGLGREGPSTDLLGRLVREIDWTAAGPDPESLRDAYQDWMRDPGIGSNALWVLASVLDGPAGVGWFRPEFVSEPDADASQRRRTLAMVVEAWPEAQAPIARGELMPVDAGLLDEVDRLLPEVTALVRDASDGRSRLEALLAAERLALATTLLASDRGREAEAVIGLVMQQVDSNDTGVDIEEPRSPTMRSNDGEFAAGLADAGRDADARVGVIESLFNEAVAGDLGPLDAEALVAEAWRGAPALVRETARRVIVDVFVHGPGVAVELLDTFDRASRTDETAEFVESVTGVALPSRRDDDWDAAVRRALARHAIRLLDPTAEGVDRLAAAVADTVEARAAARGGDRLAMLDGPAAAAIASADAARRIAAGLFLAPGGDRSLEDLDRRRAARRRLAPDAIRRLVAEHVSELEYLEFVLEARVPVRRDELRKILDDAADDRARADSGLRQAARTVLRMAELDRVRMVPRDTDPLGGFG